MGRMMSVELFVLGTPEDAVVETEHIEGGHGCNSCHNPTHHRAVGKAGSDDFILRAEAREEGNTGDGQTGDEEGSMSDGHILAQSTHR